MSDSNNHSGVAAPPPPAVPVGTYANPEVPEAAPAPAPGKSALTVWALIVAIVAIVSAVIPVLSFVAWVPALVATILGIVGLVSKRSGRGKALTAVILGPIALLVAIIVSFGTIAAGVSDALPSAGTKPDVTAEAPAESEAEAEPVAAAEGTRDNPAPAGSTIVLSDYSGEIYEIVFGAPTLDANAAIAAENMFNEPADAGFQYVLLPLTFTYLGTETGTPWIDVSVDFVSAAGTTHGQALVVEPQPVSDINEMYTGASAAGNLVFMVPTADIESGTWAISPLFGEKYFVAVV